MCQTHFFWYQFLLFCVISQAWLNFPYQFNTSRSRSQLHMLVYKVNYKIITSFYNLSTKENSGMNSKNFVNTLFAWSSFFNWYGPKKLGRGVKILHLSTLPHWVTVHSVGLTTHTGITERKQNITVNSHLQIIMKCKEKKQIFNNDTVKATNLWVMSWAVSLKIWWTHSSPCHMWTDYSF